LKEAGVRTLKPEPIEQLAEKIGEDSQLGQVVPTDHGLLGVNFRDAGRVPKHF
jgi:hypothetical protein